MGELWGGRQSLLDAYRAAIDVFEGAVRACPDDRWDDSLWEVKTTDPWVWPKPGTEPIPGRTVESIQRYSSWWAVGGHCAFFLDFYLSGPHLDGYAPPPPFEVVMDERWEADGCPELPSRRFTKDEIGGYIAFGRDKAERVIPTLTEAELELTLPGHHPWANETFATLLRVNVNHVNEHGGSMAAYLAGNAL